MSDNRECFNNDISFQVAPNEQQITAVRLFGEKLLHIELATDYGKKEIVCGNEAIQNFVMLLGKNGIVERFDVSASYCLCANGNIKIALSHSDGVSEEWLIDLSKGEFAASGERTLNGTLMLSEQKA